jgi:Fic family protein
LNFGSISGMVQAMPQTSFLTSAAALQRINVLKRELDALRPLNAQTVRALDDWHRVELTYTSNAIEGNTLTRSETAVILEKGLTVGGGKSMREHLEAINHGHAYDFVRQLATGSSAYSEMDIRQLQALITAGDEHAEPGSYSSGARTVAGSKRIFPGPSEIGPLMRDFVQWLSSEPLSPDTAVEAHSRLVEIHPFSDGNGRTARLLMNAILWRGGYPPAIVEPADRAAYIDTLEIRHGGDREPHRAFMLNCVLASAERYLAVVKRT